MNSHPMKERSQNPIPFESLINSFSFDCWAVDKSMVYIYQNPKSMENWGQVVGKSVDELAVDAETKATWKKQLQEVFEGQTLNFEYPAEGHGLHLKSIITPLRDGEAIQGAIGATIDITDIKESENKILEKTKELERVNTALHVLLEKREKDKSKIEEELIGNIQKEIMPLFDRLKAKTQDDGCLCIIHTIENNLKQLQLVSSEFHRQVLSHTELQVFNFVKQGKTSKEIAEILSISKSTVDTHRDKIRQKLGLKTSGQNLKDFFRYQWQSS